MVDNVVVHTEHSALKPVAEARKGEHEIPEPAETPVFTPPPAVVGMFEAAGALGVTYTTLGRYIKDGKIKALTLPSGRKQIPVDEVLRVRREMGIDTD